MWLAALAGGAGALVAAGSTIDHLPRDEGVADTAIEAPTAATLDRIERRPPPPSEPLTEPRCLGVPGDRCLRWSLIAPEVATANITVVGDRWLTLGPPDDGIVARRLHDGEVLWSVELEAGTSRQQLTTGDLLITTGRDGISARSLEDGDLRWRADPPADDTDLFAARQVGDRLILAGFRSAPGPGSTGLPDGILVGLDAATGEAAWQVATAGPASVGPDGTSVHLDEDGQLVALSVEGTRRWVVPAVDPDANGGVYIVGRYAAVWQEDGNGEQLHRLRDGRPLGFMGMVLGTDGEHTLIGSWPPDLDAGDDQMNAEVPTYRLLDGEDEEVWRTSVDDVCSGRADLQPDRITIASCRGDILVLDPADGRVIERSAPPFDDEMDGSSWSEPAGPYVLRGGHRAGAREASVLIDTRDGTEVAHLPPDAHFLGRETDRGWGVDLGGVALIQHRAGIAAIDLPPYRVADTRRSARGSSSTLR
ncbi:MAG: PQQ-binding-like beta-propeller repeat protein [Nitriliruptor sp.]